MFNRRQHQKKKYILQYNYFFYFIFTMFLSKSRGGGYFLEEIFYRHLSFSIQLPVLRYTNWLIHYALYLGDKYIHPVKKIVFSLAFHRSHRMWKEDIAITTNFTYRDFNRWARIMYQEIRKIHLSARVSIYIYA